VGGINMLGLGKKKTKYASSEADKILKILKNTDKDTQRKVAQGLGTPEREPYDRIRFNELFAKALYKDANVDEVIQKQVANAISMQYFPEENFIDMEKRKKLCESADNETILKTLKTDPWYKALKFLASKFKGIGKDETGLRTAVSLLLYRKENGYTEGVNDLVSDYAQLYKDKGLSKLASDLTVYLGDEKDPMNKPGLVDIMERDKTIDDLRTDFSGLYEDNLNKTYVKVYDGFKTDETQRLEDKFKELKKDNPEKAEALVMSVAEILNPGQEITKKMVKEIKKDPIKHMIDAFKTSKYKFDDRLKLIAKNLPQNSTSKDGVEYFEQDKHKIRTHQNLEVLEDRFGRLATINMNYVQKKQLLIEQITALNQNLLEYDGQEETEQVKKEKQGKQREKEFKQARLNGLEDLGGLVNVLGEVSVQEEETKEQVIDSEEKVVGEVKENSTIVKYFGRAGLVLSGVLLTAGIIYGPSFLSSLGKTKTELAQGQKNVQEKVVTTVTTETGKVSTAVSGVGTKVEGVGTKVAGVGTAVTKVGTGVEGIQKTQEEKIDVLQTDIDALKEQEKQLAANVGELQGAKQTLEKQTTTLRKERDKNRRLYDQGKISLQELEKRTEEVETELGETTVELQQVSTELEQKKADNKELINECEEAYKALEESIME